MKSLIIFIISLGIGFSGFSQTTSKNTATLKKSNNMKINPEKKEIHTHTYTYIPKDKLKKMKFVYPSANKHLVRRLTPQEAAELKKLKEKQKNKQQ